jgi:hypothetical protein
MAMDTGLAEGMREPYFWIGYLGDLAKQPIEAEAAQPTPAAADLRALLNEWFDYATDQDDPGPGDLYARVSAALAAQPAALPVAPAALARAMYESDPDFGWDDLDESTQQERIKEAADLLESASGEPPSVAPDPLGDYRNPEVRQAAREKINGAVNVSQWFAGQLLDVIERVAGEPPSDPTAPIWDDETTSSGEPPALAGLDVERLRAWFIERGWSIHMQPNGHSVLDPFVDLAARLAAQEPQP